MKFRYLTYTLVLASAALVSSCVKEVAQTPQEPEISIKDAAMKGELLIKFTPDVVSVLKQAGLTKAGNGCSKAGIPSVDEILANYGAYEFRRVFPVNESREEATRKAGLDLWYLVRFDASYDIETVARELSALGQVQGVEYNHGIKRAYNADKRPVPFVASKALTKAAGMSSPDDPFLPYQWNLINDGDNWTRGFLAGADVNVQKAWEKCTGDPSVIVAVVDEGIFYNHPDLVASMWRNEGETFGSDVDNDGNGYAGDYFGFNFVKGSGVISYNLAADSGHGSHVAGVIAAHNNNGVGISSIAGGNASNPGVKVMSCQIFSGNYVSSILAEVEAIKYAADNGAVILQCSWGYTSSLANPYDWAPQYGTDEEWMENNIIEKDALLYFINTAGSPNGPIRGGIGVFAAGNESAAAAGYPGAYGEFVSVIGSAPDYTPAVYTNYGLYSDICAPGGDQDYFYDYIDPAGSYGTIGCILSTVPYHISESGYAWFEGSSMATPHVSAALALAISYAAQNHLSLTADQYKELLYSSATPIDDYMVGEKGYYKYVVDLGQNQYKKMQLESFRGKLGHGFLNVNGLLDAVKGVGTDMVFPNVLLDLGAEQNYNLGYYFKNVSDVSVSLDDPSLASFSQKGNMLVFTGLKEGMTKGRISCGGESASFILTVKAGSGNGWMF